MRENSHHSSEFYFFCEYIRSLFIPIVVYSDIRITSKYVTINFAAEGYKKVLSNCFLFSPSVTFFPSAPSSIFFSTSQYARREFLLAVDLFFIHTV